MKDERRPIAMRELTEEEKRKQYESFVLNASLGLHLSKAKMDTLASLVPPPRKEYDPLDFGPQS